MVAANHAATSPGRSPLESTVVFSARRDVETRHGGPTPNDAPIAAAPRSKSPLIVRNLEGEITHVQISRWRRVTAGPRRRIASVVRLSDGVAVLIEKTGANPRTGGAASCSWQAYDEDGRLTAVMQLAAGNRHALLINYQTRQVCCLVREESGSLKTVDAWSL